MKLQTPTNKSDRLNTRGLLKTILALALGTGLTVAAWAAPAVVEKGTKVAFWDQIVDLTPCIGEWVHDSGSVTYKYHVVVTPNGESLYHELWLDGNASGTIVGLTTGTIWTLEKIVSPCIIQTTENGMMHWTSLSRAVSETGATLQFNSLYDGWFDEDGELQVKVYRCNCQAKD
jgi:hypothetical protein